MGLEKYAEALVDFLGQNWAGFVEFMDREYELQEDDCDRVMDELEEMAGIN